MSSPSTSRHRLPYLAVSQAQKEITHNEALARIDALLHPVVETQLDTPPFPAMTDTGRCWLVGPAANAGWTGHDGEIATWIGGGWRFAQAVPGMRIRRLDTGVDLVRSDGDWVTPPTLSDPAGGTVVDAEARQAISDLFAYLRTIGTIEV